MMGKILSFFGFKTKKKRVKKKYPKYEQIHHNEVKGIDSKLKRELAALRAEVAFWKHQYEKIKRYLDKIEILEKAPSGTSLESPVARRLLKKAAKQDYIRFRDGTISLSELSKIAKSREIKVFTVDHRFLGYLDDIVITNDPIASIGIVVRRGKSRYLVASSPKLHDLIHRPENTEILRHGILILQRTWEGDVEPYVGEIEIEIDEEEFLKRLANLEDRVVKSDILSYGDAIDLLHDYVYEMVFNRGEHPEKVAEILSKEVFGSEIVIPQVRSLVYDKIREISEKRDKIDEEVKREEEKREEKPQEKKEVEVDIPLPKLGDKDWEEDISVRQEKKEVEEVTEEEVVEEVEGTETQSEEPIELGESAEDEIDRLFKELSGEGDEESENK